MKEKDIARAILGNQIDPRTNYLTNAWEINWNELARIAKEIKAAYRTEIISQAAFRLWENTELELPGILIIKD